MEQKQKALKFSGGIDLFNKEELSTIKGNAKIKILELQNLRSELNKNLSNELKEFADNEIRIHKNIILKCQCELKALKNDIFK